MYWLIFFKQYPKFSNNDFYISGESYAGHYIPTLVYEIYKNLATSPNAAPQSNFKGFAAGNPLTDEIYDFGSGIYLYYQTHGMLPLTQNSGHPNGNYDPYDIF
jgi:carboxypeptidase C (cathepsin A)